MLFFLGVVEIKEVILKIQPKRSELLKRCISILKGVLLGKQVVLKVMQYEDE